MTGAELLPFNALKTRFIEAVHAQSEFHDAMLDIYSRAARDAGYDAKAFIGMVVDRSGLATARYLLDWISSVSEPTSRA